MFFKAVKGGRLNSRTPNTSTELCVNLVDSLSLNFLDGRVEMCIQLYEEFLCQYEFQLSLLFSSQNKELETKFRSFVCFNFIFNINAQVVQYLIVLTFEVRMIYVHLGFFLWLLLIPFIYVEERKMKNYQRKDQKSISEETKGRMKQSCVREKVKRSVSKYRNRRTTKLLWAMRQRKYFRTKNKNNLDIYSYVRCLTQRNCKGLNVM